MLAAAAVVVVAVTALICLDCADSFALQANTSATSDSDWVVFTGGFQTSTPDARLSEAQPAPACIPDSEQ